MTNITKVKDKSPKKVFFLLLLSIQLRFLAMGKTLKIEIEIILSRKTRLRLYNKTMTKMTIIPQKTLNSRKKAYYTSFNLSNLYIRN